MGLDIGERLLGSGGANFGLRSGAETFGDVGPHLDAALGVRTRQRLSVGIGDHKFHPSKAGCDHVVDGVAARTAHTEYGDTRLEFGEIWNSEIDGHGGHPIL